MNQIENLYHIHRLENGNEMWNIGDTIEIKKEEDNDFYKSLIKIQNSFFLDCRDYDIDYAIAILEGIKHKCLKKEAELTGINALLRNFYLLRREQALEIGRTIYHKNAPSRLHSLFLTNQQDIPFWLSKLAPEAYQIFHLDLEGEPFVSSTSLFPEATATLANQVEQSKNYWQPLTLSRIPQKEYLFQGTGKILKEIDLP